MGVKVSVRQLEKCGVRQDSDDSTSLYSDEPEESSTFSAHEFSKTRDFPVLPDDKKDRPSMNHKISGTVDFLESRPIGVRPRYIKKEAIARTIARPRTIAA